MHDVLMKKSLKMECKTEKPCKRYKEDILLKLQSNTQSLKNIISQRKVVWFVFQFFIANMEKENANIIPPKRQKTINSFFEGTPPSAPVSTEKEDKRRKSSTKRTLSVATDQVQWWSMAWSKYWSSKQN